MARFIVGNWKMNGTEHFVDEFLPNIASLCAGDEISSEVVICPPFTLLERAARQMRGSFLRLGAQDVSMHSEGAYTGEISAAMLKEAGCQYVIVGHSERRQYHSESNAQIKAKAEAAIKNSIIPIICVGENLAQREAGQALAIVATQLAESLPAVICQISGALSGNFMLAYEPVWAIGSGRSAVNSDIAEMHNHIYMNVQNHLASSMNSFMNSSVDNKPENYNEIKILYGGSVKADNAHEILKIPRVSGVLVGGASLRVEEFFEIIRAE